MDIKIYEHFKHTQHFFVNLHELKTISNTNFTFTWFNMTACRRLKMLKGQ